MQTLKQVLGDYNIEDLAIKFTAVTADVYEEKEVWLNSGSLLSAIRASISLPMFLTPYKYNHHTFVDGGILNTVPIAPTFHDNTDITIAVNLGSRIHHHIRLEEKKQHKELSAKIKNYFLDIALLKNATQNESIYNIANKSFDTMQGTIARVKLAAYPPDIEIKVPRDLCGMFEFDRVDALIRYGYDLCAYTFEK